jgi:putative restriction endonuclease
MKSDGSALGIWSSAMRTGESEMELVTTWAQIAANIVELERLRQMGHGGDRDYRSLIQLGTIFLPYDSPDGTAFAPSRFLGYVDNSLSKHAQNDSKDGRKTTPAISAVLGRQPAVNNELDSEYRAFCTALGLEARETGNFGAPRRFWVNA